MHSFARYYTKDMIEKDIKELQKIMRKMKNYDIKDSEGYNFLKLCKKFNTLNNY